MSRNLKSLGLALMGLLALTAVVASSASAVNIHSKSSKATTYVTVKNENENRLDLANGANVKCNSVIYEGNYETTTVGHLTLKPTYKECLSSGQTTTIDTSKCNVTLTTPTTTAAKNTDEYHGQVAVVCSGGNLVVSVGDPVVACTVTVESQELTGVLDYTDITTTTPKVITALSTLEVHYKASGSVCGAAGLGKLTGALTATGYSDEAHKEPVDLWID